MKTVKTATPPVLASAPAPAADALARCFFTVKRLVCTLLLGAWFGAALASPAAQLTSGPTLETQGPNTVTIRWKTDVACGSRVHYGPSPTQLNERAEGGVGASHVVTLEKLTPGVTYFYTVGTARVPLATNSFCLGRRTGTDPAPPATAKPDASRAAPAQAPSPPRPPPTRETWGHMASLQDHFDRHGADFNAKTPDDYARMAWEFRQRAIRESLPAKRDETGVVRVFDPKSRAFAAYNADGTTKTYFKPRSRDYFERQPGEPMDARKLKP
jgi:hypothetical protein